MTKKTNANDPFDIQFADLKTEEKAFHEAADSGDYTSIPQEELLVLKDALAQNVEGMLNSDKEKGIYIRINESDLINIKAKAKDVGMPYQTYLKSFIHRLGKGEVGLGL